MTDEGADRKATIAKIAVVALVVIGLLVAWRLGVFARFKNPEALKESLLALGAWGYLAFVLAYAILQPFGVPGTVFIMAAPLIWRWEIAFALSMTGTMAASCIGFWFARFVAKDWMQKRMPKRFAKYNEALERRAFATVVTLRFLLWMPPMLHAFFGVSKVRFWTHFWGSFVGYIPPLFAVSYFGQKVFGFLL